MEQAHHAFLVFKGTGFNDRTGQHLGQAAADGIDHDTDQDARERRRKQIRQESQSGKPQAAGDFRRNDAGTVAQFVHDRGADEVHDQLRKEEAGGNQRQLSEADMIGMMKCQKQQRNKVCTDCLGHKAEIARQLRAPVLILLHLRLYLIFSFAVMCT